jgi:hypothetical protein
MRFHEGNYVTVQPVDSDPWVLHMQRQVTVDSRRGGGWMVRLDSTASWDALQGPIPEGRMLPGWVEQDGRARVDEDGWPR